MSDRGNSGKLSTEAIIGAVAHWHAGYNANDYYCMQFEVPLMPVSVNHYAKHPTAGVHFKSKPAKAFENDFALLAPRDFYVRSESGIFAVTLEYWPGPNGRGDVDNYNKQPLDCCAKMGYFRDKKGERVSDACVKQLTVIIHDRNAERLSGPKMRIKIEAIPKEQRDTDRTENQV